MGRCCCSINNCSSLRRDSIGCCSGCNRGGGSPGNSRCHKSNGRNRLNGKCRGSRCRERNGLCCTSGSYGSTLVVTVTVGGLVVAVILAAVVRERQVRSHK